MTRLIKMSLCITIMLASVAAFAGGTSLPANTPSDQDVFMPAKHNPVSPDYFTQNGRWLFGVGGGLDAPFFGNRSQALVVSTILPPPDIPADIFTLSNNQKMNGTFQVRVGYQWLRDPSSVLINAISLAAEFDYAAGSTLTGQRFVQALSGNTNYSYHLSRQSLLLLAKLNVARWGKLMPFFQAGAGVSRNEFSDYKNPGATAAPVLFPNADVYELSFVAGLGLDFEAAKNFWISAEYRFGYWGQMNSGKLSNVQGTYSLSHTLYSNQALLSFNAYFNA